MAEAFLNWIGRGRFRGHSAGSQPAGKVNPFALQLLARNKIGTEGLRSKSGDEFARPGAPRMAFVFTVCDDAAGEACPVWPGQPVSAHWGVPDPARVRGTDEEMRKAFVQAFAQLALRVRLFIELPFDKLERKALEAKVRAIGRE